MRNRVRLQVVERVPKIDQQQLCKIAADSVVDQDSLNGDGLALGRQRIGSNQPAPQTDALRQVMLRLCLSSFRAC